MSATPERQRSGRVAHALRTSSRRGASRRPHAKGESRAAISVLVISLLLGRREAWADAASDAPAPNATGSEEVPFPARLDVIEIRGLVRTRQDVVLRELPWRVGQVLTRDAFELGITRLWNTPLFSTVAGRLIRRGGETVAVIEIEERWPLTPILELQSGGHATWFHVGLSDRNVLGRYLEAEAFYEYFDGESGGQLWFRNPRLFDERLELVVIADRLMRPRPDYVVRTTRGRLELNHLVLDDRIRYGARVDVFEDDFAPPTTASGGSSSALPGGLRAATFEPSLRVGRIDTVRLRDQGLALETRVLGGTTSRSDARTFLRVTSTLDADLMAGERWNFGLRLLAGHVSRAPDELQFFIGGLDLLRGYPDNFFKATSYALYNADIKLVAFDSRWLAVLPLVFSDGATIRRDVGSSDTALSAGGGVIFVIPKIADSQLRIDVGVPLRAPHHPGIGFGTMAFF